MQTPPKMPSQPLTKAQRMSYRIARGEMGVLTFEPYKSEILPLWRFKTPSIARQSSSAIYAKFLAYNDSDDFIGMDMSRKFLQMGKTRAKRYANHKGGRKYDKSTGEELPRGEEFEGRAEKLEASLIFKEAWERAKTHEGYLEKKERFVKEQKEWDRAQKAGVKVKSEEKDEGVEAKSSGRRKTRVKAESAEDKVKTEVKEEGE